MITDAPWYVPNMVLRQDLQITSIKAKIQIQHPIQGQPLHTSQHLSVHLTVPPDDICASICPPDLTFNDRKTHIWVPEVFFKRPKGPYLGMQ
jgi:hypothetical protein